MLTPSETWNKLKRHGATRVSWGSLANTALNEAERRLGRGTLRSNPDIVHIEPTTACNLGCAMCGRSTLWNDLVKNSAHMPRDPFLKLVPFLRTARLAVLHGWGEPLLHPDLVWMVQVCKRAGCMVTFHTNGLLLTEKTAIDLMDAGLDHITVSIDGATSETYKEVRGGRLATLLENLKHIDRLRRQRKTPYPRMTFKWVVMKKNLQELPLLVDLAEECGVGEIELQNLIVYNPELAGETVFDQREEVEAVYQDAVRRAHALGIRMFYGGVEETDGIPACPFRSFTVTCDGTVGPCGAQRFAMGNIHDTPLRDLWNHQSLVEMRLGYARRELPHQCQHCPGRTNTEEDHVQPDLTYVDETLQARQWEKTQSARFGTKVPTSGIVEDMPTCHTASDASGDCASGGCSS